MALVAPTGRRTWLRIWFKEDENGNVSIEKVFAPGPAPGGENELALQQPPNPTGTAIANLVTVQGSTCVVVNIGGGYYYNCF
jgi:hypothetical protein